MFDNDSSVYDNFKDNYQGSIIHFGNYERSQRIENSLSWGTVFTEALVASQFKKGGKELFFITLDGNNISWCCLATRKKRVVTDKYRVEFRNFNKINPPIALSEMKEEMAGALKHHFVNATSGNGGKMSPKTWISFVDFIEHKNPDLLHTLLELYNRRFSQIIPSDSQGIGSFRKDASSFALSVGDIDLQSKNTELYLDYPNGKESMTKGEHLPPFLRGIEPPSILEDRIIEHDSSIFGDWNRIGIRPDMTAQFKQGDRVVTIQNFNRHKVEEQIGVDLLYYNHWHMSYILVQYKKMDHNSKAYRPNDLSYHKELKNFERITELVSNEKRIIKNISEYRLDANFCFFKVCESKGIDIESNKLIPGMYFPLELWQLLMNSNVTLGPKQGRRIGYNEVSGRYLNNSQFIDLFKNGWIGSQSIGTEKITEIIKDILENKKSLILASSSIGWNN